MGRVGVMCGTLAGVAMLLCGCNEPNPRALLTDNHVVSPEGWQGTRFFENDLVVAEEFDAYNRDGRIDLWRFYEQGRLAMEEADRDSDGRIDLRKRYELGGIVQESVDGNHDGILDTFTRSQYGTLIESGRDLTGNGMPDEWTAVTDGRVRSATVEERRSNPDGLNESESGISRWLKRIPRRSPTSPAAPELTEPQSYRTDDLETVREPVRPADVRPNPFESGREAPAAGSTTPVQQPFQDMMESSESAEKSPADRSAEAVDTTQEPVAAEETEAGEPAASRYGQREIAPVQEPEPVKEEESPKTKRRFFLFSHPSDSLRE